MTQTVGMCDVETGLCAVPDTDGTAAATAAATPLLTAERADTRAGVVYVTDPICSACWVSEPAWRSVAARYADVLDIEHVFGGLLPSWDGFLDAGAGIRQPSDVAHHWDEFAAITGQPIDASVWLTDPLPSSFPPSIAATAVRLVAPQLEHAFLRRIREDLFLDARNIARPEVLAAAAAAVGADVAAYESVIADGTAEQEFINDRMKSRAMGVRGFPTVFVEGPAGRLMLHGIFGADQFERALLAVTGIERRPHLATVAEAIAHLGTGTTAEYAATLGRTPAETEQALAAAGMVRREVGGGTVWQR